MKGSVATTQTQQFAGEHAGRLLRHLAFQINQTIKSCTPDSVHDVRVAIRRFTQALAVFKPCFPGKEIRKIRRRLKGVMKAAGQVRDCDVALKLLAKSQMTDNAQFQAKVRSRRKEAARLLVVELKSLSERQSSIKWRAALEAALARNGDNFGGTAIDVTARRTLRRMMKDFFQHGNEAAGVKASAEDLHGFRLAAKKFRYSLELFAPLYGSSWDKGLAQIKAAQTLLGDVNDCASVAVLVSELGGSDQLAARLKKRQRRKTEEFRQYWDAEFRQGEQLRSWMDTLRLRAMKKPVARAVSASSAAPRKPASTAKRPAAMAASAGS